MIKIKGNKILDSDNKIIKVLACPFESSDVILSNELEITRKCENCNRIVYDTDYMSEESIVDLLARNPNACIKINTFNPIFVIEEE